MKKFIAILAVMGVMTFGLSQSMMAQDSTATATDSTASEKVEEAAPAAAPVAAGEESFHKSLKTKYIEGDAGFMSLVAVALVFGLAFCIERIIYLALSKVNTVKLIEDVEEALLKKYKVKTLEELTNANLSEIIRYINKEVENDKSGADKGTK